MSRLDEIKARCDAATEGPWQWRESEPTSLVHVTSPRKHPWNILKSPDWGPTLADAEFIAAAREDVPWLVSEVERLERWKAEALEVISGLQELGKALGLRPGVQITGPAALAEVARLTAERDALAGLLAEFVDNEPCSLDHHGYCQSHGHLDEGECHMARARAALAEADTSGQPCGQDQS